MRNKILSVAVDEALFVEDDVWAKYLTSSKIRVTVVSPHPPTIELMKERTALYSGKKNFQALRMNGVWPKVADVYILPAAKYPTAQSIESSYTPTSEVRIFIINDESRLPWETVGKITVETWGMIKTILDDKPQKEKSAKSEKIGKGKRPSDPEPHKDEEPAPPPIEEDDVPWYSKEPEVKELNTKPIENPRIKPPAPPSPPYVPDPEVGF